MNKYNLNNFYDFIFDFVYTNMITDETINELLNTLTPRESQAIKLRFGLDCEPHTLRATGAKINNLNSNKIGITVERCRQMIYKATRKLRHPSRHEVFLDVMTKDISDRYFTLVKTSTYNALISNKNDSDTIKEIIKLDTDFDIELLCKLIEDLDLTQRSTNCLRCENILFIGDLIQCNENRLLKIPGLGRKSYMEIKLLLKNRGFDLNTPIQGWDKIREELNKKFNINQEKNK
ncbi:MAG: DNA-directed RNA polymerase subunit alpha C-terminal domain-containing protein [Lutibacter sp.]|jgi:hypothetical protein